MTWLQYGNGICEVLTGLCMCIKILYLIFQCSLEPLQAPKVTPEESIVTAAAAIAKAVTVASSQTTIINSPQAQSPLSVSGVCPGRAAEIRL